MSVHIQIKKGTITKLDLTTSSGQVQVGRREYEFSVVSFVSGWPARAPRSGDQVKVRLAPDGDRVLSLRLDAAEQR